MKTAITLNAWRGDRYIGLAEILVVIGRAVLDLKWSLNLIEVAIGPDAEALDSFSNRCGVGALELLHVAAPDVQIIDGMLEGYDLSGNLQIKITAVDSSSWDIECEDPENLVHLRERFNDLLI